MSTWYSDGTIEVAEGGDVATGTGTAFLANVRVGDAIAIAGSATLHEVTNIASNQQLTFQPPFAGQAGSALAYRIAPVQGYVKRAADRLAQIVAEYGDTLAALGDEETRQLVIELAENITPAGLELMGKATAAEQRQVLNLDRVDNSPDADKPVSAPQLQALNAKADVEDVVTALAGKADAEQTAQALAGKVDKEAGKGLSHNDLTDELYDKLASIEGSRWQGVYTSLEALATAKPVGEPGWFAWVDAGEGQPVKMAIWDIDDQQWRISSGEGGTMTPAQVLEALKANPDVNVLTDAQLAKLVETLVFSQADKDKLDSVDTGAQKNPYAASQAEAQAGTGTELRSWAPNRLWQAITANVAAWWTTVKAAASYSTRFSAVPGALVPTMSTARGLFGTTYASPGNLNWNDMIAPGCQDALMHKDDLNGPGFASYAYCVVYFHADPQVSTGSLTQMAISYSTDSTAATAPKIKMRARYNGSWGPWADVGGSSGSVLIKETVYETPGSFNHTMQAGTAVYEAEVWSAGAGGGGTGAGAGGNSTFGAMTVYGGGAGSGGSGFAGVPGYGTGGIENLTGAQGGSCDGSGYYSAGATAPKGSGGGSRTITPAVPVPGAIPGSGGGGIGAGSNLGSTGGYSRDRKAVVGGTVMNGTIGAGGVAGPNGGAGGGGRVIIREYSSSLPGVDVVNQLIEQTAPIIMSGQIGTAATGDPAVSAGNKIPFNEFWATSPDIQYDSANRRFHVAKAGLYRVRVSGQSTNGATRLLIGLNADAPTTANHRGQGFANASGFTINAEGTFQMASGNYVVFYVGAGAIFNDGSNRFGQFSIERVG